MNIVWCRIYIYWIKDHNTSITTFAIKHWLSDVKYKISDTILVPKPPVFFTVVLFCVATAAFSQQITNAIPPAEVKKEPKDDAKGSDDDSSSDEDTNNSDFTVLAEWATDGSDGGPKLGIPGVNQKQTREDAKKELGQCFDWSFEHFSQNWPWLWICYTLIYIYI